MGRLNHLSTNGQENGKIPEKIQSGSAQAKNHKKINDARKVEDMRFSAEFCRDQADLRRAKAATEPLENRRAIELLAAKSWDQAAIEATNAAATIKRSLEPVDPESKNDLNYDAAAKAEDED
jgi:predicted dienelactone hydrolase